MRGGPPWGKAMPIRAAPLCPLCRKTASIPRQYFDIGAAAGNTLSDGTRVIQFFGDYAIQPRISGGYMAATSDKTIESVLNETRVFPPSAEFVKQANISGMDAYRKLCAEAETDFTGFWARLAREHVLWKKPFSQVLDESNAPFFKWFVD